MNRYRLLVGGIRWFLIIYFVGGLLGALTPKHEIFPVSSWFLFPVTPNPDTKFALRLYRVEGKTLEPPRFYEEADGFVADPQSIIVYEVTQELGKAERRRDAPAIAEMRHNIETNYIRPPCRYELVAVTYDPVERWKTGKVQTETIKIYSKGETQ